jgi:transcription initiation factor TFIID subunit 15
MLAKTTLMALVALVMTAEAASIHQFPTPVQLGRRQNKNNGNNNNNNNNNANTGGTQTCLSANALQTGSKSTGQVNGVAADGQVNSKTYASGDGKDEVQVDVD